VGDVIDNVGYGENGTEFEGNYVEANIEDVKKGVVFGSNNSKTGTYNIFASDLSVSTDKFSVSDTDNLKQATNFSVLLNNIRTDLKNTGFFANSYVNPTDIKTLTPKSIIIKTVGCAEDDKLSNIGKWVNYQFELYVVLKGSDVTTDMLYAVEVLKELFKKTKRYDNLNGVHISTKLEVRKMFDPSEYEGVLICDTGLTLTCKVAETRK
jgi:hypothetical protein